MPSYLGVSTRTDSAGVPSFTGATGAVVAAGRGEAGTLVRGRSQKTTAGWRGTGARESTVAVGQPVRFGSARAATSPAGADSATGVLETVSTTFVNSSAPRDVSRRGRPRATSRCKADQLPAKRVFLIRAVPLSTLLRCNTCYNSDRCEGALAKNPGYPRQLELNTVPLEMLSGQPAVPQSH